MDARFKYASLAAGYIAKDMGFFDDEKRVEKLFRAIYEAIVRVEPTICPTMWAEGAVTSNVVKPRQKGKRND